MTSLASSTGAERVPVRVVRLAHGADLPLPAYQTEHAAGCDLHAAVSAPVEIAPGGTVAVPTGLQLELPPGFEGQVRPRSGLALRHSVGILNAPGTIDADYRGEVQVLLTNFGREPFTVRRGERIGQLVVARHGQVAWVEVATLAESARGSGGFGHTGR